VTKTEAAVSAPAALGVGLASLFVRAGTHDNNDTTTQDQVALSSRYDDQRCVRNSHKDHRLPAAKAHRAAWPALLARMRAFFAGLSFAWQDHDLLVRHSYAHSICDAHSF
jgi:hypothetical protein